MVAPELVSPGTGPNTKGVSNKASISSCVSMGALAVTCGSVKLLTILVSCGVSSSVPVVEPSFRLSNIQQLPSASLATW